MKSLKEHAINRRDNVAIAVVCGGSSSYSKLSRFTGQCIADALRVKYKKVEVLELDATTLEHAIEQVFVHAHRVLIEERIQGREIKVGILESAEAKALSVIEVQSSQAWLDFERTYTSGCQKHIIPAPLPDSLYRRTQELAIEAHRVLGCRDLSIVEVIVPDHGEPVVIEVKAMSGVSSRIFQERAAVLRHSGVMIVTGRAYFRAYWEI